MLGKILKFGSLAAVLGLVVVASWAMVDTGIHLTSDDEFCSGCHSHAPIGSSYREDIHGGNNSSGWRASCADCHIPHDNSVHYMFVKSIHGVRDPLMELIKDPRDIAWHGHRELRENYTYDSGCLACHRKLEDRTQANPKAFLPHRDYFAAPDELSCVTCHKHVGHKNLGNHLQAHGWKLPGKETEQ